jgi:hypothetical protein
MRENSMSCSVISHEKINKNASLGARWGRSLVMGFLGIAVFSSSNAFAAGATVQVGNVGGRFGLTPPPTRGLMDVSADVKLVYGVNFRLGGKSELVCSPIGAPIGIRGCQDVVVKKAPEFVISGPRLDVILPEGLSPVCLEKAASALLKHQGLSIKGKGLRRHGQGRQSIRMTEVTSCDVVEIPVILPPEPVPEPVPSDPMPKI